MQKLILLVCLTFVLGYGIAQNKTVTIGIISDIQTSDSKLLLQQMKNNIEAVAGKENNIVFKDVLENNFDFDTASSNYNSLLNDDTDIILAFGIMNTIMLYKKQNYPKPIVVLSPINRDFIEVNENQKTSNVNNITYLITPFSFSDDLKAFETLYDYKKIGIVIDHFLLNILPIEEYFNNYFSEKERDYKMLPVHTNSNINEYLHEVDAVYLVSNSLKDKDLDTLINNINKRKIPSISATGVRDVEKGILLTYQPEVNASIFIRRIALDVEAIINGTNPADLPISVDNVKYLSINYNTANQIDFPLRYSLLASVNFIEGKNTDYKNEKSYSIIDVMQGVLNKNLALSADEKEISLSAQNVKSSKSSYLPNISASASGVYIDPKVAEISNGQNPEFSTSGNLTLEQLIYSEQATANTHIQKHLYSAQKEVYNTAQLDALLNASVAYFNALILKTNVKIQNQNLQITKKNLKIAEQNFEVGAAGKSDVLRFKSQLSQNIQGLVDAGNTMSQAITTINQLMNNPISNKIGIDDAELSKGLFKNYEYETLLELLDNPKLRTKVTHFLVEEALNNAPELKNIGYNMEAVKRNYKLNKSGRFIPTVALQGNYNYAFTKSGAGSSLPTGFPAAPDGTYNFGLNLSIPIFQQNQQNINRQSTLIQQEQLNIQKDNIALNIEKNVNDIVFDLIKEISNIEISKANEEFSKESLDLSQEAYKAGSIPVIQLLDAQNNYLQAQLARATAQYNYLIVSMQLERAIGHFFLMNTEESNQDLIQRATQFIVSNN